jgi:chorismate mutase/prephenate dehydratase
MYGIIQPSTNSPEPVPTEDLESLRGEIDGIDHGIISLLAQRRRVARRIASAKQREGLPFRDLPREQELLMERLAVAESFDLDPELVSRMWEQIIADTLKVQFEVAQRTLNGAGDAIVVAIQGVEGSNSHRAALALTTGMEQRAFVSCARFVDALRSVEDGVADLAVLPIENTTSGAIAEVYDLLLGGRLAVVGEVKLQVRHCLLGGEGARVSDLKTIRGHPQAVAQCSEFLATLPDVEVIYAEDTGLAARRIAEVADPTVAAIASEKAARLYGLQVLARGINNREANYTRFLAVARDPLTVDLRVPAKTSLVMAVSNEAGALAEVLNVFRDREIALVKLESRPMADNPWEEMFYLDFEGNLADPAVDQVLAEVRRHTTYLRVLGSYPSGDLRPHQSRRRAAQRLVSVVERQPSDAPEVNGSYKLASRREQGWDSVVELGGVAIGAEELVIIAGPCAVESFDQVMETARVVKEAGAHALRGGCFKPRTSPYSFQGLGWEALDMLAEAGRAHGLPIVTEVMSPDHVERMAERADVLQIGTRNMQNFPLLTEVGSSQRPVLLKRGMSASIEELLQAAEYILAAGNQRVVLCERGIRTFETAARNTLDITAVPVLRQRSHLPVIVDPSHAAGSRELVAPLAMAGAAAGAHGLMIEVHPDPDAALSDGPQALTPSDFSRLMEALRR